MQILNYIWKSSPVSFSFVYKSVRNTDIYQVSHWLSVIPYVTYQQNIVIHTVCSTSEINIFKFSVYSMLLIFLILLLLLPYLKYFSLYSTLSNNNPHFLSMREHVYVCIGTCGCSAHSNFIKTTHKLIDQATFFSFLFTCHQVILYTNNHNILLLL